LNRKSVLLNTLVLGMALLVSVPMATANEARVAFVNINFIMEQSPQAEAALEALEREFSPRDAELVAERDALRQMQERLERDSEVMGAEQRAELERNFRNRSREFKRAQDMFSEDLNARRNEELGRLQRLVQNVILELAQQERYDVVVTERNVLFASERINITETVLEKLREQHGR
jgi:outer membrane protein